MKRNDYIFWIIIFVLLIVTLVIAYSLLFGSGMEIDEATLSDTYYINDINWTHNSSQPEGMYNILIPVYCNKEYDSVEAIIGLYNEEGQKVGYVQSSNRGYYDQYTGEAVTWKGVHTPKNFVINATAVVESGITPVSSMSEYSSTVDFNKEAEKNVTDRTPVYVEVWLYDTSNYDVKDAPLIGDRVAKINHI